MPNSFPLLNHFNSFIFALPPDTSSTPSNQAFNVSLSLCIQDCLRIKQVTKEQYTRLLTIVSVLRLDRQSRLQKIAQSIDQLAQSNCFLKNNDENQKDDYSIMLVKQLATQDAAAISQNIQDFGIKDEKALIEIATICAQKNINVIARCIQAFGIKNRRFVNTILQRAYGCSWIFHTNMLDASLQRLLPTLRFAKLPQPTLIKITAFLQTYLSKYSLENLALQLLENLAVQINANEKLNRTQEQIIWLISICEYAAWQNVSPNQKETLHYEILKTVLNETLQAGLASRVGQEFIKNLPEYIQHFSITDQRILIEIAKTCANLNCDKLPKYIRNFGIQDPNVLIEIAKTCAKNPHSKLSKYIQNFGIQDPNVLLEITKICAAQCPEHLAQYIQNYGIEDQDRLIEIAKNTLNNDIALSEEEEEEIELIFPRYIQNFGIQDEKILIAYAETTAEYDPATTSQYIQNFGIKDQTALIKIAEICAQHDIKATAKYIQNFGIQDKTFVSTILYKGYGSLWIFYIPNPQIGQLLPVLQKDEILQTDLIQIAESLHGYLSKNSLNNLALPLLKNLSIQNLPLAKLRALKNQIIWLISLCEYASWQEITLDQLATVQDDVLKDLLRFPDPTMRDKLTTLLFRSLSKQVIWQKNVTFPQLPKGYTSLPSLILLPLLGESQSDFARDILKKFFHSQNSDFGKNQRIFIHFLEHLYNYPKLSQKEKMDMLNLIFSDDNFSSSKTKKRQQQEELSGKFKKVLKAMAAISVLCNLDQFPKTDSIDGLFSLLTMQYQALGITAEDMQRKFLETIGEFRDPQALLTYLGSLQQLPSPEKKEATDILKQFVREVLDGIFTTERYKSSPHLDTISNYFPNLLEQWKKGGEVVIAKQLSEQSSKRDYAKFFSQKLIDDQHLGLDFKEKYPVLAARLQGKGGTEIETSQTGLFESYCFRLLQQPLAEEEEIKTLKELLKIIPQDVEFRNDIKGILQNNNSQKQLDLRILDTDDPCDLLLIGTEVPASCQRVDGDAKSNIGLLGYLMDGKIRAMVIKGNDGKIVGRSIIRLLWDNQKKQAVLHQDRYYGNEKYKQLVKDGCEARATTLGVPLVVETDTDSYHLESLGGRSPWEYVDSLGGPVNPIYSL